MAHVTRERIMPPWSADDAHCPDMPPFRGDLRLSAEEIHTLTAWAEAGAPEGSPAELPPVRAVDPLDADLELALRTPIDLDGQSDRLMCHVFDPQSDEDLWLRAFDVVPGSTRAVHHVNLFVDLNGSADALDPDGDGWFGCFNWPTSLVGYSAGSLLPGSEALRMPDELGMLLPAGGRIVAQIHYEATGFPETDSGTRLLVGLHDSRPAWLATVAVVGNLEGPVVDGTGLEPGPEDREGVEFFIPAGAREHVEVMRTKVPGEAPARIWSLTNHMHYAGSAMRLELERGGERACWLDTPRWDFDWQRSYVLDGPIDAMPELRPGDSLVQTCTYDNSEFNARLLEGRREAGADAEIEDIVLGDTSLDEMCLSFVGLAVELGPGE